MEKSIAAEIYVLRDPRTGEIRYVGKAVNSAKRFKGHLREANRRDFPVYRWIRKLSSLGLVPAVEVFERAADWREAERRIIRELRKSGARLLNVSDGGDAPPVWSQATLSANGKALSFKLANDPKFKNVSRNGAQAQKEKFQRDPEAAKLAQMKRTILTAFKAYLLSDFSIACMRECFEKRPDLFSSFGKALNGIDDEWEERRKTARARLGL